MEEKLPAAAHTTGGVEEKGNANGKGAISGQLGSDSVSAERKRELDMPGMWKTVQKAGRTVRHA